MIKNALVQEHRGNRGSSTDSLYAAYVSACNEEKRKLGIKVEKK